MLFITAVIPNPIIDKISYSSEIGIVRWEYSSHFIQGNKLSIIWNWLILIAPILVFIGFLFRKKLYIFIPLTYVTGLISGAIIIIQEMNSQISYMPNIKNMIIVGLICLLFFFPPLFTLQSALARRHVKLTTIQRIIEGVASAVLLLSCGYGEYVIKREITHPNMSLSSFLFFTGIAFSLTGIIFSSLMGILNCTKCNDSPRTTQFRIWGIAIASSSLILFTLVSSIISYYREINDFSETMAILRFFLFYVSVLFMTAHSGAWILVRHITIQPKYDIRVTSLAEEDGWDDEKS
jgi:hypothetical protein